MCSFTVVVKDNGTLIRDNLKVYKAFSPNGDGINDLWSIGEIEQYPDNSVTIFDRWGSIIFQARGYNNEHVVWDGTGNSSRMPGRGVVPAGTYFYSIRIHGMGSINGYVELIK
jgi:gliding motility-associated-like protein